jgi:hypothetical protein
MMDLPQRVNNAVEALTSGDLESRIGAVEELAACSSDIAGRVATVFEADEEARFLVFERLSRFGSVMITPMERVYLSAKEENLKLMSASALLYLGSNIGAEQLMAAIRAGHPNLCMAATSLTSAGILEAAEPIEHALLECDLSDTAVLECLASSLRRLEYPMSESVRSRLLEIEPKWLRDSLLD